MAGIKAWAPNPQGGHVDSDQHLTRGFPISEETHRPSVFHRVACGVTTDLATPVAESKRAPRPHKFLICLLRSFAMARAQRLGGTASSVEGAHTDDAGSV
jgi:hypothetical protein